MGAGGEDDECPCVASLSETEAEVLAIRGKAMVCDPTCSDGSDLTWGELLLLLLLLSSSKNAL